MKGRNNVAMIGVGIIGIPVLTQILTMISHEIDVTVYSFIPIDKHKVPPGVRIRFLPRNIHQRIKYLLLGSLFVLDHLRRPFDLIHAQSAFPGGVLARRLARFFKIPWMVTLIGGEVEAIPEIPFGDLLNRRLKAVTTRVCAEANVLTVMSQYQAQSVRSNLGIDREIRVLPYAPALGTWTEKKVTFPVQLLHVAYHYPVKNQHMLLKTVERLVSKIPFNLTIIGENYGQAFRDIVVKMNLESHVTIKGPQSYNEMRRFYSSAHILVHTSWYEGLPTVAFEAMANGLVVCGTHVGILADFSGVLCRTVDANDDLRLAQLVHEVATDESQYNRLRRAAYAWAAENDSRHYVNQMVQLYRQLKYDSRNALQDDSRHNS